ACAEARLGRGWNRIMLAGDWKGGFEDFDAGCRTNPDFHALFAHRGWARTRFGQQQEALADFDRAIELSRVPLYLRWRSEIREATGDREGALRELEELVRLPDPDD